MVIKKTTCKCGQEYIDFDNQLGQCPDCSDDTTRVPHVMQDILKSFTYMETAPALKLIVRLLAQERIDKIKEIGRSPEELYQETHPVPVPEARGLCNYIKKVFRRK